MWQTIIRLQTNGGVVTIYTFCVFKRKCVWTTDYYCVI